MANGAGQSSFGGGYGGQGGQGGQGFGGGYGQQSNPFGGGQGFGGGYGGQGGYGGGQGFGGGYGGQGGYGGNNGQMQGGYGGQGFGGGYSPYQMQNPFMGGMGGMGGFGGGYGPPQRGFGGFGGGMGRDRGFGGGYGRAFAEPQVMPQQPAFLQDQEFQGYRQQADDLSKQMNEYMQKAPMYQQLQDLQGKMRGVEGRYSPQPAQQATGVDPRMVQHLAAVERERAGKPMMSPSQMQTLNFGQYGQAGLAGLSQMLRGQNG